MLTRVSIGAAALAGALCLATVATAQEAKKYAAFEGLWNRGTPVGTWDPKAQRGQGAPLKPEFQAILDANRVKQKTGFDFDPKATCGPTGMPRMMTIYDPVEIVVTQAVTYMLLESTSPIRRIFTDGRDWPKDVDPSYAGYSIGKWVDSTGSGTYDRLEIETRYMKGKRLFDGTGTPLAEDGSTVVYEKLYVDKTNPDILHIDVTTEDNALTQPWSVQRFAKREHSPMFEEYNCTEDNRWIAIGGRTYMIDSDGYFMPVAKDEPPPDPKYFQKYFSQNRK